MFFRTAKSGNHYNLLLVRSYRKNGAPRQEIIANFGDIAILKTSGQLDDLLNSLGKYSNKSAVISESNADDINPVTVEKYGPVLVFDAIWKKNSLPSIINNLLSERKFEFNVERTIFANVLQRLLDPGSDRSLISFLDTYNFDYKSQLMLQHSYRAMNWLGDPLDGHQGEPDHSAGDSCLSEESAAILGEYLAKGGKGPKLAYSVRTNASLIEELMYLTKRNLLTQLDMYFFDTTSFYFEGSGGDALGQFGFSKDHRPDRKQVVMGAVLDKSGIPICTELWPGNTSDVTTALPIANRLRSKFLLNNVCLVADRGMISKGTIDSLLDIGWSYILGVKMRNCVDSPNIFSDMTPYLEITKEREKSSDPAPLKVKSVIVNDTRYIICLNPEEARKDAHDRENVIKKLTETLKKGDKSLVGNKGYKKFLASSKNGFSIDESKVKDDAKYDGIFILTTNLDIPMEEVAIQYKQLLSVESFFRNCKSTVNTRPIYHQTDSNIRGHIWISFLALLLKHYLLDAINKILPEDTPMPEWKEIIRSLNKLSYSIIQIKDKKFRLSSNSDQISRLIFKALTLKWPLKVQQLPDDY
jgi:transposase